MTNSSNGSSSRLDRIEQILELTVNQTQTVIRALEGRAIIRNSSGVIRN